MFIRLRTKKAQSILEYAAIVILVSAAISTMTIYIQRAMNVRFRHIREELNESQR